MAIVFGPLSEGMDETPDRVFRYWVEAASGLHQNPAEALKKTFPCAHSDLVIIKSIPFNSLCEHHLLPFYGVANVGYIPNGKVAGLSKVPRSLDILAKRPQLQERLTTQFCQVLDDALSPQGVIVILSAQHSCMSNRGVLKAGAVTVTRATTGIFQNDMSVTMQAMNLIGV
jgi:GTP cyclohydrolase I